MRNTAKKRTPTVPLVDEVNCSVCAYEGRIRVGERCPKCNALARTAADQAIRDIIWQWNTTFGPGSIAGVRVPGIVKALDMLIKARIDEALRKRNHRKKASVLR